MWVRKVGRGALHTPWLVDLVIAEAQEVNSLADGRRRAEPIVHRFENTAHQFAVEAQSDWDVQRRKSLRTVSQLRVVASIATCNGHPAHVRQDDVVPAGRRSRELHPRLTVPDLFPNLLLGD